MGKSKSTTPMPTTQSDTTDNSAMYQLMAMSMLEAQQNKQQPALPSPIAYPAIDQPTNIDWTKQNDELAAKMRADYTLDAARRKSVAKTTHVSPLLEDEDPVTATSILSGQDDGRKVY